MRFPYIVNILIVCGCVLSDLETSGGTILAANITRPAMGPLRAPVGHSRYFVSSQGDSVYLTGSHTHLNLMDRQGEDAALPFAIYLEFLKQHHHNFTKLWAWEDARNVPLPYQRVGPEMAMDGKPKFDLAQLNHAYFDRLRERVIAAGEEGIYVAIMLFNGWSVEGKKPNREVWSKHPFHSANNVNAIDGDLNGDGEGPEVHTLNNPAVTAIQEAYVRKVIDSVHDLDNVLYEIVNEGCATFENTAWQYHMIDFIHQYERTKPKQHPVGMTVQYPEGKNQVLYDSPADWISPNSDDGYEVNPPAMDRGKVVLSDTDHMFGNGGSADWVWMSFTRGLNPIFMDLTPPLSDRYTLSQAEEIRVALGDTFAYAQQFDRANMTPRQNLCSTTFCLANPGQEYLIYFRPTGCCSSRLFDSTEEQCQLTLDLTGAQTKFDVEWFFLDTRKRQAGDVAAGGAVRTFILPACAPSVLYLKAQGT
jgi:Family of unknown function (DUF6298)